MNIIFRIRKVANYNKEYLRTKIPFLESKIEKLFVQLNSCDNFEKAKSYFKELEDIQTAIARLMFKYEMEVPEEMRKFVKDFDRVDDPELQKYLFQKFQNGDYEYKKNNRSLT